MQNILLGKIQFCSIMDADSMGLHLGRCLCFILFTELAFAIRLQHAIRPVFCEAQVTRLRVSSEDRIEF